MQPDMLSAPDQLQSNSWECSGQPQIVWVVKEHFPQSRCKLVPACNYRKMLGLFQECPSAFSIRWDFRGLMQIKPCTSHSLCSETLAETITVPELLWGAQCRLESSSSSARCAHKAFGFLVPLIPSLPFEYLCYWIVQKLLLWIFTVLSTRSLWSKPGTQDVAHKTSNWDEKNLHMIRWQSELIW